jgi:hypothetical protein
VRASINWKFCLRRRFPAFPAACISSKKWKSFFISPQNLQQSQLLPKIPISGKSGPDIIKSAAVPKIANIGKFWKRAHKKKEEISSSLF